MSSTDQTPKDRTTTAGPTDSPTESTRSMHKLDLSPTKITGGALAAMTAAALGAQLSVVGTVIGAALASVVAAVASALYTASLQRTGNRVRRVWQRGDEPVPAAIAMAATESANATPGADARPTRRRLSWSSVLVGALAAFGLAAAALTGIELITGQALSGGDGTTVTQVSGGDHKQPAPVESPSPSPNPERTMSAEPTGSPTTEASPTEATTPTPDPEPTTTASSPEPTETATAPTPTPTSAEPTIASPSP